MCNRYRVAKDIEKLRTVFANAPANWFEGATQDYVSFYPGNNVLVFLRHQGEDLYKNYEWGIFPYWAKLKKDRLTNTKSEEALAKPTWQESFRERRCLMPATSFFEPATVGAERYQIEFTLSDGSPFAFAGIWQNTDKFGPPRTCCSLLTCEPNTLVGEVHGRMPVILRPEHFDTYLNTPPEQAESLLEILVPYPAEEMRGAFNYDKEEKQVA